MIIQFLVLTVHWYIRAPRDMYNKRTPEAIAAQPWITSQHFGAVVSIALKIRNNSNARLEAWGCSAIIPLVRLLHETQHKALTSIF